MTSSRTVVFAEPVRTAIGTLGGNLKDVAAPDLGAAVIKAALERAGLKPEEVGQPSAIGELADQLDALGAREQIPT